MPLIVPAILAYSEEEFRQRISNPEMRALTTLWQIDILDGTLFENTSWSNLEAFSAHFSLPALELHLMVADPLPYVRAWKERLPQVKRAIIHAEIPTSIPDALAEIRSYGLETGLALNPETLLSSLSPFASLTDTILLLGVNPGFSGRSFQGELILEKIRTAKAQFPEKNIAVDGGITLQNAPKIIEAGANELCISSALWQSEDPIATMRAFQRL